MASGPGNRIVACSIVLPCGPLALILVKYGKYAAYSSVDIGCVQGSLVRHMGPAIPFLVSSCQTSTNGSIQYLVQAIDTAWSLQSQVPLVANSIRAVMS